jgi:protein ImuB
MPLNLAKALTYNPIVAPFQPLHEYRSLFRLTLKALSLSPLVALDNDLRRTFLDGSLVDLPPEYSGFIIDVSGTEKLHRGESFLIERLMRALNQRGLQARVSIASTIGCAWAHSRYNPSAVTSITNGINRESLNDLPLPSLRLELATINSLHELGITTVGELLRLPFKDIGLRFGVQTLRRIHQCIGTVDEHFEAIAEQPKYVALKRFEIPLENVYAALDCCVQLLRTLLIDLNLYALRAGSFKLAFTTRCDNDSSKSGETRVFQKELSLQTASNDTASILQIVAPVIESLKVPSGIIAISVTAEAVTKQLSEQQQIFNSTYARELQRSAEELLNTLSIRIGPEHINRVQMHESHIPERSFRYVAAKTFNQDEQTAKNIISAIPARPPQILKVAERISAVALLPDRPPARIEWRGAVLKIIQGKGPERIAPEWWREAIDGAQLGDPPRLREQSCTRDYFTLQDHTGRWLWVYRDIPTFNWWLHGIF